MHADVIMVIENSIKMELLWSEIESKKGERKTDENSVCQNQHGSMVCGQISRLRSGKNRTLVMAFRSIQTADWL